MAAAISSKTMRNLSSQSFNPFEERLTQTLESRDKAQEETNERKVYMINITAETDTMLKRAQTVVDQGGEYVMVDILTCGWSALQTLREQNFKLVIHAHRAGHAAFTKNPFHGIAMKPIATVARVIGVDQLHVGTVVGKMSETKSGSNREHSCLQIRFGFIEACFARCQRWLAPTIGACLNRDLWQRLSLSKQVAASTDIQMAQSAAPKPCGKPSTQLYTEKRWRNTPKTTRNSPFALKQWKS